MRVWRLDAPDCPECTWQVWCDDELLFEADQNAADAVLAQFIVDACNEKERREQWTPAQAKNWAERELELAALAESLGRELEIAETIIDA